MFRGQLYPTQKEAAEFLANKKRAALLWEQGTGKTIISIATAEKLFELGKAKNALILAPTGIAWQWEDKIHEFTDSRVLLTTAADKASRTYGSSISQFAYHILPYSLFRNDYTRINRLNYDIVIADEAQEFKNNGSKTAQLIKRLNRRKSAASYRWALTGTAISNKLEELYSIMRWVEPNFLPEWKEFERRHIIRAKSTGIIVQYKNLSELNEYLKNKVDRKTQKDLAGQLPRLVERVHKLPKSTEYRKIEKVLARTLEDYVDSLSFNSSGQLVGAAPDSEVTRAFKQAHQAASTDDAKLRYAIELANEILTENSANKVVIFSLYKHPLHKISSITGWDTFFTGDQDSGTKRKNIERFKEKERVLLASNAGASGLDLPMANYVIHLDVPFSHGILDQRNKRITRASSNFDTAVVNYCIIQDSLEDYYYLVVKTKKRLADAVLEGTENSVKVRTSSLRKWIS